MSDAIESKEHDYEPNRLLDALREKLQLKSDAELSRELEVAQPIISRIRHRKACVGAAVLIRMHEVSGLTIGDLRNLMGDRRIRFRAIKAEYVR